MKIKVFTLLSCLTLMSFSFAAPAQYVQHPAQNKDVKQSKRQQFTPGFCEIEILNRSYDNVRVYGTFDDGMPLKPENVYLNDSFYVDLFYYGYCHQGMMLYIDTFSGYRIYSGYTSVYSTVRIVPSLRRGVKNALTVEVVKKK